jgi:hypothetical protein
MLTLSIAGYFSLNIYAVTLSVNDGCLKTLFAKLYKLGIILLEDVDVVKSKSPKSIISLSALLDVIDGLRDSYIVVMTTYYIKRLDSALMQPSCVDVETEF